MAGFAVNCGGVGVEEGARGGGVLQHVADDVEGDAGHVVPLPFEDGLNDGVVDDGALGGDKGEDGRVAVLEPCAEVGVELDQAVGLREVADEGGHHDVERVVPWLETGVRLEFGYVVEEVPERAHALPAGPRRVYPIEFSLLDFCSVVL